MGKKSKGDLNNQFQMDLVTGDSKTKKLLDRYGVEGYRFGGRAAQMGNGSYRSAEMVQKDLSKAMASDYDTRRSLEAAAMSGDKKAKKLIDNGFDSVKGIYKTQEYFDKAADKQGYKNFSSPNDYMSLTQHFVNQDRKAQTASYDEKYASKADLENMKQEDPEEGFTDPQELSQSTALSDAKERVANFEAGGIYGDGGEDEQDAAAVTPAETEGVAASMLDNFKSKLKQERNFKHEF